MKADPRPQNPPQPAKCEKCGEFDKNYLKTLKNE